MTYKFNDVRVVEPVGPFGEVTTADLSILLAFDPVYGLRTVTDVETFSATGGTVTTENLVSGREFRCRTGTSVGGYGLVRSLRTARYRPGQGVIFRYACRFDQGVALSALRAGAVTSGNELSFGYNGADFGVLHRRNGQLEMQRLTLSAAATGAETATITLGGTEFTTSLTSGTTAHNAFEIASDTFTGYNVYQNNGTVLFEKTDVGTVTQDFTFSSTGTAAGTFEQVIAGQAVIDNWYYQNKAPYWNVDKLDGTGPSGLTLDPTKGNVYQIDVQYLGYGAISYSVYHPQTRQRMLVHRIEYSNSNTGPNLGNPNLKVGAFAASLGSTTDLNTYLSSAAAFTTGEIRPQRNPIGYINSKSGIGTSFTNILSFRVRPEFNGTLSLQEVILNFVDIAVEGTKPAEAILVLDATLGGEPNWQYIDQTNSVMEYDTSGTTVTVSSGATRILAFSLGKSDHVEQSLNDFSIKLLRGKVLTMAVRATSGTTDASVSLIWQED